MELATLKTYLSDPELPQERVYLVAIKGIEYEFTLKRKKGENPLLIIPDAGGQMDVSGMTRGRDEFRGTWFIPGRIGEISASGDVPPLRNLLDPHLRQGVPE